MIEMGDMGDVTTNGVLPTENVDPKTARVAKKARKVATVSKAASSSEDPFAPEATHSEPTKKKAPHKVTAKPKAKASAPKSPKKHKAKKAHASPKAATKTKKSGKGTKKRPRHWTDTKAQLVMHATPQLVDKLDKALPRLGKKFKIDRPTRGSIVRKLVEEAVKK
jgi:hypothetical protein